jgi:hypothetical protein
MTVIEVRPYRNGWQVYESAGVQPVFLSQQQAETILPIRDRLPKLKNFPAAIGGSGETLRE